MTGRPSTRGRDAVERSRSADRRPLLGRLGAVGLLIVIVLVVTVPTAIWFGAADFIFETRRQGLVTFFGTLALLIVVLGIEFAWDWAKERRKERRNASRRAQK